MSYKAILVALWDKARIVLKPHWVKSWIMTLMHIPFLFLLLFFKVIFLPIAQIKFKKTVIKETLNLVRSDKTQSTGNKCVEVGQLRHLLYPSIQVLIPRPFPKPL